MKHFSNEVYFIAICFAVIFVIIIFKKYGLKEYFVTMPGNLDLETCLATCAKDSQCQVALYDASQKKCNVARDFEIPESTEVAYRKANMVSDPHTFISSDVEQTLNTDTLNVTGQGLPIDWTQDGNNEQKLSKEEMEAKLSKLESSYSQTLYPPENTPFNPPSIKTPPYTPSSEGAGEESLRSRGLDDNGTYKPPENPKCPVCPPCKNVVEQMENIGPVAYNNNTLGYSKIGDDYIFDQNINKKKSLKKCLFTCGRKPNCKSVLYNNGRCIHVMI